MSDLVLYVDASGGLDNLRPLLSSFPFAVELHRGNGSSDWVLVQSAVSDVAGFGYYGSEGGTQSYGIFVVSTAQAAEDDVVSRISAAMQGAQISHRITRTYDEIEDEDVLVSYRAEGESQRRP